MIAGGGLRTTHNADTCLHQPTPNEMMLNKMKKKLLLQKCAHKKLLMFPFLACCSCKLLPEVRRTPNGHVEFDLVISSASASQGDEVFRAVLTLVLMNPKAKRGRKSAAPRAVAEGAAAMQQAAGSHTEDSTKSGGAAQDSTHSAGEVSQSTTAAPMGESGALSAASGAGVVSAAQAAAAAGADTRAEPLEACKEVSDTWNLPENVGKLYDELDGDRSPMHLSR